MTRASAFLFILAASLLSSVRVDAAEALFLRFDPSPYSQLVTSCDQLAAHPDDPFKVSAGVAERQVNLADAIPACQEAVAQDPKNPRLNYQLARVLGYSGRGREAIPYRRAAVEADYPQSLFVIGYITLLGLNQQPQDTCRAGQLLHRSARYQRLAGLLGFPRYVLEGRFSECPNVRQDTEEMRSFVAEARKQFGSDYYKGLLAEMIEEDLRHRLAPTASSIER